jgi:hypothetical protein
MKKLLATAALLTVVVTPAFAQSFTPSYGTGNIAPMITPNSPDGMFKYPSTDHSAIQRHTAGIRNGAHAQAPAKAHNPKHASN